MKINKKDLKSLVQEVIGEMNLDESDIIAKEKSEWNEMKKSFTETIQGLIDNIEDDDYTDAKGDIDKAIKTLKVWKGRITKNLSDSTRF